MKTRLEAFVDLLYRRREVRESAPSAELPALDEAVCARCPVSVGCSRNGSRPGECALTQRLN
jgi:hypothetical protein